jgi:hypothetical protein
MGMDFVVISCLENLFISTEINDRKFNIYKKADTFQTQPDDWTWWAHGNPNEQNGICVWNDRAGGFVLKWFNQPCNDFSVAASYFCQQNTCELPADVGAGGG